MTKFFTTIALTACILTIVPACAKKTTKVEPKVEQQETETSVKNDKENYAA